MPLEDVLAEIHRKQVGVESPFVAPTNLTFAWQEQRRAFSVWYRSDDKTTATYVVLGTGTECPGIKSIRASCVMPDGFTVFHLCELLPAKGQQ